MNLRLTSAQCKIWNQKLLCRSNSLQIISNIIRGRYHIYQWIVGISRDVAFNDPHGNQICMFVLWIECLKDIICWCFFVVVVEILSLKVSVLARALIECFNNYEWGFVLFCLVPQTQKSLCMSFLFPSWCCLDAAVSTVSEPRLSKVTT